MSIVTQVVCCCVAMLRLYFVGPQRQSFLEFSSFRSRIPIHTCKRNLISTTQDTRMSTKKQEQCVMGQRDSKLAHYNFQQFNGANATRFCCLSLLSLSLGFPSSFFANFVFASRFLLSFFSTMAKKRNVSGKKKKKTPIDRVPKHSQQPRSSPPKRRTDFSFFTSPSSLSIPATGTIPLSHFTFSVQFSQQGILKFFHSYFGFLQLCVNPNCIRHLC